MQNQGNPRTRRLVIRAQGQCRTRRPHQGRVPAALVSEHQQSLAAAVTLSPESHFKLMYVTAATVDTALKPKARFSLFGRSTRSPLGHRTQHLMLHQKWEDRTQMPREQSPGLQLFALVCQSKSMFQITNIMPSRQGHKDAASLFLSS